MVALPLGISQNDPWRCRASDPQCSPCIPCPEAAAVPCPSVRSEGASKKVWFPVSTSLHTRSHPPKKGLATKRGAALGCVFQTKIKNVEEEQRAKLGVPSLPGLPCGWKAVQGVKTQSTKVCTAPLLEIAPLGSCRSNCGCPKSSAAFSSWWGRSWVRAQLARCCRARHRNARAGAAELGGCRKVAVVGQRDPLVALLLPSMCEEFESGTALKPCAA